MLSLGDVTCAVGPIGLLRGPQQQGFLWGGLTMGMLLSLPVIAAGPAFVLWAVRRPRTSEAVH